ncbi:MAG: hypothetical protein AB1505_13545 [Candidatus Latescibacterota bacterium]
MTQTALAVQRITFLVHPCCYAASLGVPKTMERAQWQAYHDHEQPVLRRWYEGLERAGSHEVVVYHPCYQSAEERALAEHGRRLLGERFLTLAGRDITTPEGCTPQTLASLAPEISAAFRVRGKYAWAVHDLRIAVFSCNYAQDLRALLAERGLSLAPETLELRAWGESFEGCATTWTTMVPGYLGAPARVVIDYEMTVPDTFFLLSSRYLGRVALPHDTALYLFADAQDRPVALYKRERVGLADPSFCARLELPAASLCVRDAHGREVLPAGGELWPTVPPSLVRRHGELLEVMVGSGRGRGGEGPLFVPRESMLYVTGPAGDLDGFCRQAAQARIVPEQ